jgi:copper chaperone CopZ
MKGFKVCLSIGLFAVALVFAAWVLLPSGINSANAALAEYQIEKLTCGSCVGNIQDALARVSGVGDVEINLTSNRGRVFYDPQKVDSKVIAKTITEAGYPARLRLQLDPQEYLALQQEQAQLGQDYVARIGDRLLSRADFDQLVQQRVGGAVPAGQSGQLWQAVWKDVLQRELLLSAAENNQVIVQTGEVDLRIEELQKGHQGLEQLVVKRYGSMDNFRARIREDMIINRNIEEHVYAGITDPRERQNQLQRWYADLQNITEVIIFDQKLKAVSQANGGCGGGCCG